MSAILQRDAKFKDANDVKHDAKDAKYDAQDAKYDPKDAKSLKQHPQATMLSHFASQDAKHIDANTGNDAKSSKQHPLVC